MKTKNSRIITYLRFGAGFAFFAAAAALAFVATTTNVLTAQEDASTKYAALSKSSIRDSVSGAGAEKSMKDGSVATPLTAAMEEAAKRAFPADETPFTAQLNAIIGFKRFQASSASNATPPPAAKGVLTKKNKKQPPEAPRFNTWFPTGPTLATDPSVLTFSGAATTVSGRITALALDTASGCTPGFCRLWVGAAGGGIWRTTNALAASPSWTFLTSFDVFSNAIGSMTYDNAHGVLYVGTGEPNASADSEAGLGLMKSLDGGDTWLQVPSLTGPITTNSPGTGANGTYSGNAFFGRAISKVVIDPTNASIIYVASTRAVRGIDETYGGPTSNPPVPRPPFGLFKSVDAGQHFTFIFDGDPSCGAGTCLGSGAVSSIRGVHDLALDPSNHNIVYAADFPGPGGGGGVWRSNDGGASWTQIKSALTPGDNVDRCSFSVNTLLVPPFNTRMYVGCGNDGAATAQVFRSDLVQTGAPSFTNLTALEVVPSTAGYCSGQCWYDNVIYSPPGFPDIIYVGGSYTYNECAEGSDCRGVVYATDAGASGALWSDATWDAQNSGPNPASCCNPNAVTPNQMHPDHHFIVTVPGSPFQFFDGSDGGLVRTDGNLVDISAQCAARTFPPGTGTLAQCQLLLGIGCPFLGNPCGVPNRITSLNAGLNTLQFMSFAVAGNNPFHLQGGTQDNGTFDTVGSFAWNQVIYGDGGQGGINQNNSFLRVNTFTGQANDANFQNGSPTKWVIIGAPIFNSPETALFYPPVIADPSSAAANTIFEGSRGVWRTQDWGGSQAFLETNCPEFTTFAGMPGCGDFVRLGGAPGINNAGDLEGTFYGGDRTTGNVNVISRTTSNTNVAWAASTRGRVFISTNVDTNPATSVIWNRLDGDSGATNTDPTRVPTGIAIDTFNNFHAWVSYSGYNFNTPNQPGHIFSVSWSGAGAATWTNITNNLPDIPLTDVVVDPVTGDLYVSSDFIVFRLAFGHTIWDVAGLGMPIVEVPHLTIVPGARILYASTHGLGGWFINLY
ncbi:MAG TPA: hypothetical protein VNX27_12400 [Chthoniobacterales bacterium]|jgi:hypothetical protein|nr:hypothetical protein [Chthoniobacterales bacterium]